MRNYSPYLEFSRIKWRDFQREKHLSLTEEDLMKLHGHNEVVSLKEVTEIYLPLAKLLSLYLESTQALHNKVSGFLKHFTPKVPFIIGIAGSVGVGKSTTSRILQALLSYWPSYPRVDIVTTDGYLYPNAILQERDLMSCKGFPESYDLAHLIRFLSELKSGKPRLKVPVYSHYLYDITEEFQIIDQPDVVIVEGLNILQVGPLKPEQKLRAFVSDFFDFTIYVDAKTATIKNWYMDRFMLFREQARNDGKAFFHRFSKLTDDEALEFAKQVWQDINEKNLIANILPFKERADLILEKDANHGISKVFLRKL